MCVLSMVGDHYHDKWFPNAPGVPDPQDYLTPVTRIEFDRLYEEVLEMKELLKRAKIYDDEHDQHDCEVEDKIEVLRKVAELVGLDLDDVFGGGGS